MKIVLRVLIGAFFFLALYTAYQSGRLRERAECQMKVQEAQKVAARANEVTAKANDITEVCISALRKALK